MSKAPESNRGGGTQTLAVISDSLLSGAAASFDIQNIAATYIHLKLLLYLRSDRAGAALDGAQLRFNNDSGANYYVEISNAVGNATNVTTIESLGATAGLIGQIPGATATASYWSQIEVTVANYAATTAFKTFASLGGVSTGVATGSQNNRLGTGIYIATTAISRVTITSTNGANFITGSRCTLYGLTAS